MAKRSDPVVSTNRVHSVPAVTSEKMKAGARIKSRTKALQWAWRSWYHPPLGSGLARATVLVRALLDACWGFATGSPDEESA